MKITNESISAKSSIESFKSAVSDISMSAGKFIQENNSRPAGLKKSSKMPFVSEAASDQDWGGGDDELQATIEKLDVANEWKRLVKEQKDIDKFLEDTKIEYPKTICEKNLEIDDDLFKTLDPNNETKNLTEDLKEPFSVVRAVTHIAKNVNPGKTFDIVSGTQKKYGDTRGDMLNDGCDFIKSAFTNQNHGLPQKLNSIFDAVIRKTDDQIPNVGPVNKKALTKIEKEIREHIADFDGFEKLWSPNVKIYKGMVKLYLYILSIDQQKITFQKNDLFDNRKNFILRKTVSEHRAPLKAAFSAI